MMNLSLPAWVSLLFFPGGLFLLLLGLAYEWVDRKLVARYQNRIGPRWFQPLADTFKLLSKEEVEQVHFKYLPYEDMAKKYDPNRLTDGMNKLDDGEEIFYISNPALGLWADKSKFYA